MKAADVNDTICIVDRLVGVDHVALAVIGQYSIQSADTIQRPGCGCHRPFLGTNSQLINEDLIAVRSLDAETFTMVTECTLILIKISQFVAQAISDQCFALRCLL